MTVRIIVISIIAYFLGNVSASYLIAKHTKGIDIRNMAAETLEQQML